MQTKATNEATKERGSPSVMSHPVFGGFPSRSKVAAFLADPAVKIDLHASRKGRLTGHKALWSLAQMANDLSRILRSATPEGHGPSGNERGDCEGRQDEVHATVFTGAKDCKAGSTYLTTLAPRPLRNAASQRALSGLTRIVVLVLSGFVVRRAHRGKRRFTCLLRAVQPRVVRHEPQVNASFGPGRVQARNAQWPKSPRTNVSNAAWPRSLPVNLRTRPSQRARSACGR